MKDSSEQFSQMFNHFLDNNSYFLQALEIAKANSRGELWIIGGFVFRNLAAGLYSGVKFHSDIDFVAQDESIEEVICPQGWSARKNSYGTKKFERGHYSVDVTSLVGWHSIVRRNLDSTIENALSGTPLTIQSIAYNIQKRRIVGLVGMAALRSKTVGVNCRVQADYYAERKKKPLKQIIDEKANDLGFTPIYR